MVYSQKVLWPLYVCSKTWYNYKSAFANPRLLTTRRGFRSHKRRIPTSRCGQNGQHTTRCGYSISDSARIKIPTSWCGQQCWPLSEFDVWVWHDVHAADHICLICEIKVNCCAVAHFGVYRRRESPASYYMLGLENVLCTLRTNCIIANDSNIDTKQYNHAYLSLFCNHGFTAVINYCTRITGHLLSRIDHTFVRHKHLNIFKSGILHINITDHILIALAMTNLRRNEHSQVIQLSKNK